MKTVLYISYDGMTDPLGQSQVLPYLRGLSKRGYRISLISCEKKERFGLYGGEISKICREINIDWHPLNYTKKPPLLSTIRDLRQINKKVKELHKIKQFQLVHCRSYISALAGLKLKHNYGVKMLFDMRGFWADERIDGKIWNVSNPVFKIVYNYFKKKEKEFFIQSDHVISLTESGKQEILSWNLSGVTGGKITVIPCCVDLGLFNPEAISKTQRKKKKQSLGLSDSDFILGYVGSIGTWYMLSEMLDYFILLKREKTNARFLFITGEPPENILAACKEKNIDASDVLITACLHREVPLYISLFDESIFFIRPTYSKKASSPTKQGEIMAMGIPLICNAGVGDTDRIVAKYQSGTVIDEFSSSAYIKSIRSGIAYDRVKTVEGAKDYFSLETGLGRYAEIYSALTGGGETE